MKVIVESEKNISITTLPEQIFENPQSEKTRHFLQNSLEKI